MSFYSILFTIFDQNDAANAHNASSFLIVGIVIAAIVVVCLLVVILVWIRKKQINKLQETESFQQNASDISGVNDLSAVLPVSNIEEDPFANDFKEEDIVNHL